MSDHIDSLCRSCLFQLRQIRVLKRCLPQESVHILIKAFVSSRLDYCNSLFYGIGHGLLDKLQRIQNAAASLVSASGKHKYDHITPVLRDLHWLPIRQRIEYKLSSFVHKSLHCQAPTYLSDACIHVSSIEGRQNLRSADAGELLIPRVRTKMDSRHLDRASGTICLSTCETLHSHYQVFKRGLKQYYSIELSINCTSATVAYRIERRFITVLIIIIIIIGIGGS